ncbi:MAG TPA: hypothetical protein P5318_12705 [Candidatus Hydrogenedentes bacterium]|nr:hypothetical protein [Candidatus Hydrogenedentota bacterium]HRT20979.1 hypothetical protein [Candidatus Hydrogenedentota bacterium]HRT65808.1 hypothetical protein [Candidatus Hydrogenedentota bacterium]
MFTHACQKISLRVPCRGNDGMALLAATVFIAIAIVILGALTMRVVNQERHVDYFVDNEQVMLGIETALARSMQGLETTGSGLIGSSEIREGGQVVLPTWDSAGVVPQTVPNMPDVQYFAYHVNWITDGRDNNNDGVADNGSENGYHTLVAYARIVNPITGEASSARRVETVYSSTNINVWNNAIFAGNGQAGGLINGNVSIHGSVHLLGNNLLTGALAVDALDLSGTSLIHNNYADCPADLAARVPALPTTVFGGETISTLNAKLRVKNGLVGSSGNSEIGQPNVAGNSYKETMDGTYVTTGWSGNQLTSAGGGRLHPTNLYSDNGWDQTYDLGNKVPFPTLNDPWRDPVDGHFVPDPYRGGNYSHINYFSEVLIADPNNQTDGIYNGNITIAANQNFYWNATQNSTAYPGTPQPTDDYIRFNADTNVMEINGQIRINGNLIITRGSGNDKTIHYTGRAAILVNGDVTLNTDLYSRNANGTTANSFPVNNCFGIMATNNMTVGALSQLNLMGAFYAGNQIRCEKQTNVMGTFVANYFDMGTNVPSIWQVPELANNLPLGMIGNYPILSISRTSWREF